MIWLNWRLWVGIALAAGLAFTHYQVYKAGQNDVNVKFEAYKLAQETASKQAVEKARAKEQEWNDKLNQERDNAAKREIQLRADADSAHAANDGLRDQLSATAHRIAQGSFASCVESSSAIGNLLEVCSERYRGLAESCDGHVSDIKTLINSWPRTSPQP
jgi:RNA polymerase-binding transcription factor DksA